LARIIDGISAGNSSTARAVITDITPKDKRISKLGFTFAAESLGLIAGPLIGGYFAQYGFTVSAYMAAAIAALAFIFTLFLLPETKNFEDKSSAFGKKGAVNFNEMFKALKNTKIRIFILAVFIIQFLITVMWGSLALFGKSLFGFTGKEMGYISAFAATVGILSQIVLLNILLKLTKEKIIFTLGLTTMFLGMLCLATSSSVAVLLIGVGLMAMSFNILMPTVTGFVSELSPDEDQGRLMGIISSTTYLGSLAGPVIGNAIYSFSMRGNYLFGATIALLAALSTIKGIKIKRNQKLKIRNYPPGAD
jgi:MFS family permease